MTTTYSRIPFTLLLLFAVGIQSAGAATYQNTLPINAEDGSPLGYAHVFKPTDQNSDADQSKEPIVYLPGFDINLANLIENQSTGQQGTQSVAMKTIRDLVFTDSPNPASQHPQLLEALVDDYGHTLVILEYANDQAGIKRNAQAVETMLRDLRLPVMQSYRSTGTRSILLGWSMGGLIGRYALTKMEQAGTEHHIGLYVSYDVPHQGASFPLAIEAFVALMRERIAEQSSAPDLPAFEFLLETAQLKFNSASSREMLKPYLGLQANAPVQSQLMSRYEAIANDPANNAAHNAFYAIRNELSLLGSYPERLKKVAISNGNLMGFRLPLPQPRNGNELVRLTARIPISRRYKIRVMDVRLYDDSSESAKSNCRINYFFDTTRCPSLQMPPQLQNLSANVGSHTNVIARLASVFENQQSLQSEWLNQGYEVEFSGDVPNGEGLTTFIPLHSAFDFNPDLADVASVVAEQTPFDSIHANVAQNQAHNAVSPEIFLAIVEEIKQRRQEQVTLQALPAIY